MRPTNSLGAALLAMTLGVASGTAQASTAIEFPDNWVGQLSRGGAWLATADAPIAGFYNPAALATQKTGVSVGANFVMRKLCFNRQDPGGTPAYPSRQWDAEGLDAPYPQVCNRNSGFPRFIPNLALNWRMSERLALGVTVVPPASMGKLEWPIFQNFQTKNGDVLVGPSGQRYLSAGLQGTILFPTFSFGYSVLPNLQVGAGFVWGVIPSLQLGAVSMSKQQSPDMDNFGSSDNLTTLTVKDLFIPGVVASVLYSPTENLDVSAWYKYMSNAQLRGDVSIIGPLFNADSQEPRPICQPGQTPDNSGCAAETNSQNAVGPDGALVDMVLPMELRIGARYHWPRRQDRRLYGWERPHELAEEEFSVRDPLTDDYGDVELDLTWANNSAASEIAVTFPEVFQPTGLPSTIPPRSDRPTGWQDSFGLRLGGQYNAIPGQLGLRLGTWVESPGTKSAQYLTATGVPSWRGGVAGGLVVRFGAVDMAAGYMFVWNAGFDNGGDGKLAAVVGSQENADVGYGGYKSTYAVNGGKIQMQANVASVGLTTRW